MEKSYKNVKIFTIIVVAIAVIRPPATTVHVIKRSEKDFVGTKKKV